MLLGIAKPIPMLPPSGARIAVLIPISSPFCQGGGQGGQPDGGNIGIGFAIPSNMVKNLTEQMVKYGQDRKSVV